MSSYTNFGVGIIVSTGSGESHLYPGSSWQCSRQGGTLFFHIVKKLVGERSNRIGMGENLRHPYECSNLGQSVTGFVLFPT